MEAGITTIDIVATIFCEAVRNVLQSSTKQTIKYSPTMQSVPKIGLRPDIGCFVQYTGDYNGLVVMNFSSGAAMDLYKGYMTAMGLSENDIAKDYTSSEVADSIGEMTNQIMGHAMRMVEDKYELTSFFGQPKALLLNSAITLTIDSDYRDNRRVSFTTGHNRFYMEVAMEQTEFIPLNKK
ncbi:chemotaxis protein CheX [Candidatus Magnetomoraceae bacterium gMMP-13]